MLPELRYVENELLPMLRERSADNKNKIEKQLRQWNGEKGVCSLLLHVTDIPEAQWLPDYNMYEIHYDPEKMFISELKKALSSAFAEGDAIPSVRANVGCGALCTLYGGLAQTFFEDKMPWLLKHLTHEQIEEVTVECLEESAEFKAGLEQMRFMKDMLQGTGIELYPMDLQGPIDMAHLFMGDEFFYDLYDEPELVHKALEMGYTAAVYGMEKCFEIIQPADYVCHYNDLILPSCTPLKISEDTSTLLCKEHLLEFMKPYTEKLLKRFGGGYIHYCGSNQHLLEMIPQIRGNIGLNFGNPERHDPKAVLEELGRNRQCYYGNFPQISLEETVRIARREDGSYNAFITASCPIDEQQQMLERFHALF